MRIIIAAIIFFAGGRLHAQHPQKTEAELLDQLKKIEYWTYYNETGNANISREDSIQQANDSFRKKLLTYTSQSAASILYPFTELEKHGLKIKTSEDGLFRIYSWDTQTGGTAHVFDAIYQYKTGGKVFSRLVPRGEGVFGRWYSNIYQLNTDDHTYYIGYFHSVLSTKDCYQGVKIFSIGNSKLNDTTHLIKTTTGIRNELGFSFDFFSVVNRPERPVKLIYYEDDERKLQIPVVLPNGKVTNRFITYQFTGKLFERVKE